MSFQSFSLDPAVLESLEKMRYREPTPIQQEAIPLILEGGDLIALAETGSGKTAACAIPICSRIDVSNRAIQALVIVPTRELALQYATELQNIGRRKGISAYALFGGEGYDMQRAKLKSGVHALIATPGRLIDYIYSREIELSEVSSLILDEADKMLGMGFYEDLELIMQCLIHEHQTLLFSATMPKEIRKIASNHMRSPKEITLTRQTKAPKNITHRFIYCSPRHSRTRSLEKELRTLEPKQAMIFCRSRREVEELTRQLKRSFSSVDSLHGGMTQRLRTTITGKFLKKRIKFLVATDVASRGLDFSGVSLVVNFHLPRDSDTYLHRAGRTGRAGREGTSLSFVTPRELGFIKSLEKLLPLPPERIGFPSKNKKS